MQLSTGYTSHWRRPLNHQQHTHTRCSLCIYTSPSTLGVLRRWRRLTYLLNYLLTLTLWRPLLPYGYSHPVPDHWDRVKPWFVILLWRSGLSVRVPGCQKNTNHGLPRSGTECFTAVPISQQWAMGIKGLRPSKTSDMTYLTGYFTDFPVNQHTCTVHTKRWLKRQAEINAIVVRNITRNEAVAR